MIKTIILNDVLHMYNTLEDIDLSLDVAKISIGGGCTLGDNVSIKGPCKIGDMVCIGGNTEIDYGVEIGARTKIGTECKIGKQCKIGFGVRIQSECVIGCDTVIHDQCYIMSESQIDEMCYLHSHCIILHNTHILPGCRLGPRSRIITNSIITQSPFYVLTDLPYVFNAYNGVVQIGCNVKSIAEWRKDYKTKIYDHVIYQHMQDKYYTLLKLAEKFNKPTVKKISRESRPKSSAAKSKKKYENNYK